MNASERRSVFALAGVFASRMFGLFLLLPVLALYGGELPGSTPLLVGLALGVYGLTQALLQIPFGMLSDRYGRKRIISIGLLIFMAGSVIAALADSVIWLIIGRAIQGGGAVSAAILALTADLTREEQRTKAMALIGMSIGAVFLTSMALAPPLSSRIGVEGLFWITAGLGLIALLLLHSVVPSPQRHLRHRDVTPTGERLLAVLGQPQLLRLNGGIFVLHLVLTALFVVVPLQLTELGGLALPDHWQIYLPVLVLSVLGMVPLVILGSRSGQVSRMFRVAILVVLAGLLALMWFTRGQGMGLLPLAFALWIFFSGFNALEAMLPALVSRVAPAADKGSAIGVYNTCQFLGVFIGGSVSGWLAGRFGADAVFAFCAALVALWLAAAFMAAEFRLSSSRVIHIGDADNISQLDALVDRIRAVRGVQEVTIVRGEALAYLTVDDKELDIAALQQLDQTRGG